MAYTPLYIRKNETGLVQNRQKFILPDDAYPVLENVFVFRETLRRRQGLDLVGRLRRKFSLLSLGNSGVSAWSFTIWTTLIPPIVPQTNAEIEVGSVHIFIGATELIDQGDGTLKTNPVSGVSGTINYKSGAVVITGAGAGVATTISFNYFPDLPVMGLRSRELNSINIEQTVAFDTKYAYFNPGSGFQEFIPGTTWTGSDSDFFWSTNYWVGDGNQKIFWATNFSGIAGDPIRYTNGTQWVDFAPQVDVAGTLLTQSLALLPFRGRLVAFNTLEGANLATSVAFTNRIRWAAIGTPFTTVSPIVSIVSANAWRDDIRGKGGFLDIPTSESIVAVGFVRDNLVIYCERSTWQLRYTGRTIAPFQIEKVNSELGSESTFSAIQFDTSLVGIGDKGIVECDSYKSERIDIKIPDLVFEFKNANEGTRRVHGIRDFQQRLAYWTYVYNPAEENADQKFPNRRLVYNYENDSWAIFTDSLTCFGNYQEAVGRTWISAKTTWNAANFPWLDVPAQFPLLIAGNQQGYVLKLDSNLTPKTTNSTTLYISNITGNTSTPTIIGSPDHNLVTGQVIQIVNIPSTDPYASLNNQIFGVVIDPVNSPNDAFQIWKYSVATGDFTIPQVNLPGTYIGGGEIKVRDGFSIVSKKFNFLEQGENIQFGYLDILTDATDSGAITLNIYIDYNESNPINTKPENINISTNQPDTFFNSNLPTSKTDGISASKYWQRIFCPVRGNFITLEWTLSNAQLIGVEQESDVQIDAQILWIRPAGQQLVNA